MQNQSENRKLLLADDSITIQKVVNLTFADEGIDVISVGDGNSALETFESEHPDIILADVNMPGLTGYEICSRIKSDETTKHIPVILLVGSFEPFDEEESERVQANGYLTKPFQSISQLVDTVASLLEESVQVEEEPEVPEPEEPAAEVAVPSFPNPFEGRVERKEEIPEPTVEEPPIVEEKAFLDFNDQDEFEMSEAFADEPIPSFDESLNDDEQIEEISTDFLKTQPLTSADLMEIAGGDDAADETSAVSEPPSPPEVSDTFSVETSHEPNIADTTVFDINDETETLDSLSAEFSDGGKSVDDFVDNAIGETVVEEPIEEIETPSQAEVIKEPIQEQRFTPLFEDEAEIPALVADNEFVVTEEESDDPGADPDEVFAIDNPGQGDETFASADDPDNVLPDELELVEPDPIFPIADVQPTEEPPVIETPEVIQPGGTEEIIETSVPVPDSLSAFPVDLDEGNLLELPPIDINENVEPAGISDEDYFASFGSETESELSAVYSNGSANAVPRPDAVNAALADGDLNVNGPSQELVEVITERVIRALSEKAVKDIAWEVVPEMAELILKRMADEEVND